MEGFDLTRYQNDEKEKEKIRAIMGKVLSGRAGYEAILEERKEENKRCKKCNWGLEPSTKFCPECGERV